MQNNQIGILCCDISTIGGIETVTKDLVIRLHDETFQPIVITCRKANNIFFPNIKVFNIGIPETCKHLAYSHIDAICKILLKENIKKLIVQLNGPHKICLLTNLDLLKRLSSIAEVSLRLHGSPKSFISRYRLYRESILIYYIKKLYTKLK